MGIDDDIVHSITDGGIGGNHPPSSDLRILVGPSTAAEFNAVRFRLIPVGCWRVDDIRFDFDSSFVLPGTTDEMALLAELIKVHTQTDPLTKTSKAPPLSIFGHADPVGNDDYNKFLSGRRAAAIYGVLTRRDDVWEDLFSNTGKFTTPVAGDKWGNRSLQLILRELGAAIVVDGAMGEATHDAVKNFQSANGFAVDGNPGPVTRKRLFLAYMDKVCVDSTGAPFQLDKETGFIAHDSDTAGKGDYQGCSEFNLLLIFSRVDNDRFQNTADKTERNKENEDNRRVTALLFQPDSLIDPLRWPCPRAREGPTACRRRFWSDGEKRRSTRLPEQSREFQKTSDTFACRFYQRLTVGSPCERILRTFEIRLYGPRGAFIAEAPFEFAVGKRQRLASKANKEGVIILRDIEIPVRGRLRWGFKPEEGEAPNLVFDLDMFLTIDSDSREKEATEKLHNMGYPNDSDLARNVTRFQHDHGKLSDPPLQEDGILGDDTMDLIRDVYRSCEDDLRNIKPEKRAG